MRSLSHLWGAIELLSLDRFTWFMKPDQLIPTLPFWYKQLWKDLEHLNTLKFPPTFSLKSTIFTQLTEVSISMYQIFMPIQIFSCKKDLLWDVWIMCNLDLYFSPIEVYGKSGVSRVLWIHTKRSNSITDHWFYESKDLGWYLTYYKYILNIGTKSMESVPHPLYIF